MEAHAPMAITMLVMVCTGIVFWVSKLLKCIFWIVKKFYKGGKSG